MGLARLHLFVWGASLAAAPEFFVRLPTIFKFYFCLNRYSPELALLFCTLLCTTYDHCCYLLMFALFCCFDFTWIIWQMCIYIKSVFLHKDWWLIVWLKIKLFNLIILCDKKLHALCVYIAVLWRFRSWRPWVQNVVEVSFGIYNENKQRLQFTLHCELQLSVAHHSKTQ